MRTLTIGGKDYKIEYSFDAAEYKNCVDRAFKIVSGSYFAADGNVDENDKGAVMSRLIDGTARMFSDMSPTVVSFLYAGLLENNPVESEQDAKDLFKQFVRENPDDKRSSFYGMFDFLKECMEEDGFFKLTGLDEMITQMFQPENGKPSTSVKTPQDHKKKSTSTK